jgi:ABC-type nickel/cobalt efflux system permease component RcnA
MASHCPLGNTMFRHLECESRRLQSSMYTRIMCLLQKMKCQEGIAWIQMCYGVRHSHEPGMVW